MKTLKYIPLYALLLATPAFAENAINTDHPTSNIPEAGKTIDGVAELENQVKGLREQVQRADAIIGALSRQRNEALDRAVIFETRALAAEAEAAKKPEEPKK